MPAAAPPTARSISRCRCSNPAKASNSPRCPTARTPTTFTAPAAVTPSRTCSARRAPWPTCCGRAREQGAFDTPERRAALEARIGEVTNAIADESVRRYYRQDFSARLRQMFAPVNIATRRQNFGANRFDDKNRGGGGRGGRGGAPGRPLSPKAAFGDETYVAAS